MAHAGVVVVGAGMAGLCAAIAALEAGSEVIVLESAPAVGGSMSLSGGLIWGPRDVETARRLIPKGDADLQEMFCRELPLVWSWFDELGLPLGEETACLKDEMGRGRLMLRGESGARQPFAEAMVATVRALGGTVELGVTVQSIARHEDGWTIELGGESSRRLEAAGLVIATGGFQNDLELLRRFVTPHPESLVVRSNRSSAGAGIRLMREAGAAFSTGMSSFYGHSLPYTPGRELTPEEFIPSSQYYSDFTVILNTYGLRFTDESIGVLDEHNAQQGARQPEARYFLVFDEAIRRRHVSGSVGLPGILGSQVEDRLELVRQLGGTVIMAETLGDLAQAMDTHGVPPENVRDSLVQYNAAIDPVAGLFPPRVRDHEPLTSPPFYAVECVSAITYTMGGLRIDDRCRVLDTDGRVLPHVWAAGADAGGVFQDVYGGGLGWAAVSGRAAGAGAAA